MANQAVLRDEGEEKILGFGQSFPKLREGQSGRDES